MPFPLRGHRRALLAIAAAALYCVVVTVSAFEHHDLRCHLLNPQHCTACSASQLGSDPQLLGTPPVAELPDAGRAVTADPIVEGALLPVRSTGRSPPHV